MKTILLIPVFFLNVTYSSQAQTDSIIPKEINKTWISLTGEKQIKIKGVFETWNPSIILSDFLLKKDFYHSRYDITKVDPRMNDGYTIRTTNYGWKGEKIGYYAGIVAGGAIGCYYLYESGGKHDNVLNDAGLGALIGAVLGGMIGALIPAGNTISIKGSQEHPDMNNDDQRAYYKK